MQSSPTNPLMWSQVKGLFAPECRSSTAQSDCGDRPSCMMFNQPATSAAWGRRNKHVYGKDLSVLQQPWPPQRFKLILTGIVLLFKSPIHPLLCRRRSESICFDCEKCLTYATWRLIVLTSSTSRKLHVYSDHRYALFLLLLCKFQSGGLRLRFSSSSSSYSSPLNSPERMKYHLRQVFFLLFSVFYWLVTILAHPTDASFCVTASRHTPPQVNAHTHTALILKSWPRNSQWCEPVFVCVYHSGAKRNLRVELDGNKE